MNQAINCILFRLVLISACFISVGCDLKSSEDYYNKASRLEKQERYTEAIQLLSKAIEKNPKNIDALLNRAVDKSITKDLKGAISDYSRVLELDQANCLALYNRGRNKNDIGDYESAIADYNKAIGTKGSEILYLDKVENSFAETGYQYDVPMEMIRFQRGVTYYNVGRFKLAAEDLSFSRQKNYSVPACHYLIGMIYLQSGMKDKGCQELHKALALGYKDAQQKIDKECKREN